MGEYVELRLLKLLPQDHTRPKPSISGPKTTLDLDKIKPGGSRFSYGSGTYQLINTADKPLNSEVAVLVVDKGFAPRSVSKKYLALATDATPAKPGRL